MNRRQIFEITGMPRSTISDWANKEDADWRKKVYLIFKNMPHEDCQKYIDMGDIEDMTFDEMDDKIHLYMNVEETK